MRAQSPVNNEGIYQIPVEGRIQQGCINKVVISALQRLSRNSALNAKEAKAVKAALDSLPIDRLDNRTAPKRRGGSTLVYMDYIPPPRLNQPPGSEISPQAAKEFAQLYLNKAQNGGRVAGDEYALKSLLMAIRSVADSPTAGLSDRAVINLLRVHCHKSLESVINSHQKARGDIGTLWWIIQAMAGRQRTPQQALKELNELLTRPITSVAQFAYDVLELSIDRFARLSDDTRRTLSGYQTAVQQIVNFLDMHLHKMIEDEEQTISYAETKVHDGAATGNLMEAQEGWKELVTLMQAYSDQIIAATAHLGLLPAAHEVPQQYPNRNTRRQRPLHELTQHDPTAAAAAAAEASTIDVVKETSAVIRDCVSHASQEIRKATDSAVKAAVQEIRTQAVSAFQPVEARARERQMANEMNIMDPLMAQSPRFRESNQGFSGPRYQRSNQAMNYQTPFRVGQPWRQPNYNPTSQWRGVANGGQGAVWADQRQQQQPQGQQPRPKGCFLCNSPDHLFRECTSYPGQRPQKDPCPACLQRGLRLRHEPCQSRAPEVAAVDVGKRTATQHRGERHRRTTIDAPVMSLDRADKRRPRKSGPAKQ